MIVASPQHPQPTCKCETWQRQRRPTWAAAISRMDLQEQP